MLFNSKGESCDALLLRCTEEIEGSVKSQDTNDCRLDNLLTRKAQGRQVTERHTCLPKAEGPTEDGHRRP